MSKIDLLSKVIGRNAAENMVVKCFKTCPGVDRKSTQESYLNQYPSSKIVSLTDLLSELFNVYYRNESPENIVPDNVISSVSAHVPYQSGMTDLMIFNFLQRNYGIRDPLLVRLSVLSGEKCYFSKQYLFAPNQVKYIKNFGKEAKHNTLPKRGVVVLEAFHPRIKTSANEFRFFMFLRDSGNGTFSGVHSITAPLKPYVKRDSFCYRAYIPRKQSAYYCNFSDPSQDLELNGKQNLFREAKSVNPMRGSQGFCIINNKDISTTIWHDNCTSIFNKDVVFSPKLKEKSSQPCVTTFYVPDFQRYAPLVHVNETEIGFSVDTIILRAYSESGDFLCKKSVTVNKDDLGFDLAKVFENESLKGGVCFVADFKRDQAEFSQCPACYLHVFYRNGNSLADQVHTQFSFGHNNDSLAGSKSFRCLKMVPLFKNFQSIYSIATSGGNRENSDNTITLRVFTDMGTEHVFNNYQLNIPGGSSIIYGDELLKEIGSSIGEAAVIWIEHQTTNFNANWFAIDRKTGCLATDHFTGA